MNKFVKIIALAFLILIGVIALGLVALVTLVDPNSYKPIIIKAVNDSTGRKLSLDGDITWKLWPNIGLRIEKVSLSNPSDFATPNLISLNYADVSVQLLPLLHHSIIINSITLDGLNLDLIKNGSLNNWTFKSNTPQNLNTNESSESSPLNLQLSKFAITHSTISYNDLKGSSHYKADNFDLSITTKYDGIISLNTDKETVDIKDAEFDFSKALKGTINFNLDGFTTPKYNGKIDLHVIALGEVMRKLNKADPQLDKPLFHNIDFTTSFKGDMSNMTIKDTSFKFADIMQGFININVKNLNKPEFRGDINIPTFSLNKLTSAAGIKPIDIPNKSFLNQVSFQSNIQGTSSSINLNKLLVKITDTNISGNINVSSIQPLKTNQDLSINRFELSNIVNTKGFQILLSDINANGSTSINKGIGSLNAKQQIKVNNITISGFNLDSLVTQLDNTLTSSGDLSNGSTMQKLTKSVEIGNTIKKMQAIVDKALAPGNKNYSEKTNLGSLNANIVINNGVVNPASYKLSGPSLLNTGNGEINLNNQTMKYTINSRLLAAQKNTILNRITYTYTLSGKIDNLNGSLDWISIQKQLLEYFVKSNSEQVKSIVKNEAASAINNQIPAANNAVKQGVTKVFNSIFK